MKKRKGDIATITIGRLTIVGTFIEMVDDVRAKIRLGQDHFTGTLVMSK